MKAVDHVPTAVTSGLTGSLRSVQRTAGGVVPARTDDGGPA